MSNVVAIPVAIEQGYLLFLLIAQPSWPDGLTYMSISTGGALFVPGIPNTTLETHDLFRQKWLSLGASLLLNMHPSQMGKYAQRRR